METHTTVALIGVASFAVGAVQPLLFAWLVAVLRRSNGVAKPNTFTVVLALSLSLGACSAVLVYLASLGRAPGFAIAIPFVLGIDAARLVRREI